MQSLSMNGFQTEFLFDPVGTHCCGAPCKRTTSFNSSKYTKMLILTLDRAPDGVDVLPQSGSRRKSIQGDKLSIGTHFMPEDFTIGDNYCELTAFVFFKNEHYATMTYGETLVCTDNLQSEVQVIPNIMEFLNAQGPNQGCRYNMDEIVAYVYSI